jgi:hypothetical protein
VRDTQLLRLSRWVQRIAERDDAGDRVGDRRRARVGRDHRRHAPAHRLAADHEAPAFEPAALDERHDQRAVAGLELRRRVRRRSARALHVGKVERDGIEPARGEAARGVD